jgi:dethiobiotin synthetase
VSAALVCRYRSTRPLRYWKPIQTGVERDDDTAEVRRLAACGEREILDEGVRLPRPVSPHLAARLAGRAITLDGLAAIIDAQPPADRWVVEGAGGVLVPVNASDLVVDLIARLGLAALVVARSGLGTINHTLLTLEAARAVDLAVAAVVLTPWPEHPTPVEHSNRETIARLGEVAVWTLPEIASAAPEALAAAGATLPLGSLRSVAWAAAVS